MDKIGKKKYVVPFVIVLLIACIMALLFYPLSKMEIKNLPFAVISLDEGAQTPQGTVNAGDALVDKITSSQNDEDRQTIAWQKVDSEDELQDAFDHNTYFGALIIPKNFTKAQVAKQMAQAQEQQAQGQSQSQAQQPQAQTSSQSQAQAQSQSQQTIDDSQITLVIDNAKSPLIATQLKANAQNLFQSQGISVDVQTIHTGSADDSENASANPFSTMMSQQLSIFPTFIMSAIIALILSRIFPVYFRKQGTGTWSALGKQILMALGASCLIALSAFAILSVVSGTEVNFATYTGFLWLTSFCLMLFFMGAADINFILGASLIVISLACGMMCGILPSEVLPTFWQNWVYPWVPQRFIGEGIRSVMFMDAGVFNSAAGALGIYGAVGAILLVCAGYMHKNSFATKECHA